MHAEQRHTTGRSWSERWRLELAAAAVVLVAAGALWALAPPASTSSTALPPAVLAPSPSLAPATPAQPRRAAPDPLAAAVPETAMSMLGDLVVREDVPVPGYDRTRFGPAWADTDRNGCDARNDILRRDLTEVTLRPGTCVVRSGVLRDPYTGITQRYALARAQDVQVDHVVSMSEAWRSGAQDWPLARRAAFANDPLELLAISGATNDSKGDSNAAGWLPPLLEARCSFAARQVGVKARYGLSVTAAEKRTLQRTLEDCLGEPAVTGGAPTLAP